MKFKTVLFLLLLSFTAVGWADQSNEPIKRELDGAEFHLKKFERTVELARGKPFKLRYIEKEALRRIKTLQQGFPDNPKIKGMVERARRALIASKGDNVVITKEMLVYREQSKKLIQKFSREAKGDWEKLFTKIKDSNKSILKPFPTPSPRRVSIKELKNRWVVYDGFIYPENVFQQNGNQYLYAGKPSTGYYFFDLSSHAWSAAYEAVRRYRHQISGDLPERAKWTVAGKISTVVYLVPNSGKDKSGNAVMGWLIEPEAIYIPNYTFAQYDPKSDMGGSFSGEANLEELKKSLFSITSVPKDATADEVAKAYVTAIKEKNSKLWLDLIDPARLKTPTAISRAWYHWELHQHRWHKYYAHAIFSKPKIEVIKGFDSDDDVEGWFLSDEDKSKIKQHDEQLVELATVWVKFYDERGRQVASPSPFFLRRYDKQRWVAQTPSMPN